MRRTLLPYPELSALACSWRIKGTRFRSAWLGTQFPEAGALSRPRALFASGGGSMATYINYGEGEALEGQGS